MSSFPWFGMSKRLIKVLKYERKSWDEKGKGDGIRRWNIVHMRRTETTEVECEEIVREVQKTRERTVE